VTVEVIGIDHVFVAVRDLEISGEFYDRVTTPRMRPGCTTSASGW
jgi:hypothetical protein